MKLEFICLLLVMTSLTEAGFGTHHWILMRFEPHFSRQVIAFQRKLKTQLECMENGCDDQKQKSFFHRYLLRF